MNFIIISFLHVILLFLLDIIFLILGTTVLDWKIDSTVIYLFFVSVVFYMALFFNIIKIYFFPDQEPDNVLKYATAYKYAYYIFFIPQLLFFVFINRHFYKYCVIKSAYMSTMPYIISASRR